MRFVHTSDLHIGKTVHGFSMTDDQSYILDQIANIAEKEKADGIIIAGDVYDKGVPTEDAVHEFDRFLSRAADICPVYIVAGNHDSAERLSFGRDLLMRNGVHITDTYSGKMEKITIEDQFGPLNIYLLPYIKPSLVRPYFKDETVTTPDKAMQLTLDASDVDPNARNLLVCHQFIVGKGIELSTTDSEDAKPIVGGIDCISAELLKPFDYVALGHIHRAQSAGRDTIRYCGSPLKYSESEAYDSKSVTVVDMEEKGKVGLRTVPLIPKKDLRLLKGTIEEILSPEALKQGNRDDYVIVTLKENPKNAIERIREIYPFVMHLNFESDGTSGLSDSDISIEDIRKMDPIDLFEQFFEKMNGRKLTSEETAIVESIIEELDGVDI